VKHSRQGKPSRKTLWCDVNMTKLYWRNPGSSSDPEMDNTKDDFDRYPALTSSTDEQNFIRSHSKRKRSSTTSMFTGTASFLPIKTDQDRMLYLRDISEVYDHAYEALID